MSKQYTIGMLGRETEVNLETIRYYERINLLPKPTRTANSYRQYDETAVKRLRFIRRGRELGFGIEEIKTLLQLADHPHMPCREADKFAKTHLAEVKTKIQDLIAMRDVLAKLVNCESITAEHCRLIETLDQRSSGRKNESI